MSTSFRLQSLYCNFMETTKYTFIFGKFAILLLILIFMITFSITSIITLLVNNWNNFLEAKPSMIVWKVAYIIIYLVCKSCN